MYEYDMQGRGMQKMMDNLSEMIDTETSECAVQADYDREMILVRQMDGGVDHVNSLVKGVVSGARISIEFNILEIDTALCGENELLLNMKMYSLSDKKEMKLAKKVLRAAVKGGRVEIIRLLLKKWNEKFQKS